MGGARIFQGGDVVLKRVMDSRKKGKIDPNWKGPYRVKEVLKNDAYILENLDGVEFPRTWNVANLKFYYS